MEFEAAAPDFGAELVDGLLGGDASAGRSGDPLGARQQPAARIGKGALRGEKQQSVGGDGEGGSGLDRALATDLCLADAQQSFLVAEIDFDVPALEVSFNDGAGIELLVGADQKGRIAVEQPGTPAQAISERSDDDQLQHAVGTGRAPHQAGAALAAHFMGSAVTSEGEGFPGGIVGADLFGRGSGRSVGESSAARFLGLGMGPQEQVSILAQPADGGGVGRKILEDGAVGITPIEGEKEQARGRGGIGVEGGAQPRRNRRRGRRADRESVRRRAG